MAELRTRDTFGAWLNELGLVGEAAEIGVFRGEFARKVLSQWQGRAWHAFDFWERRPEYTLLNDWPMDFDQAFREVQALAREDERLRIHRGDVLKLDPPIDFDAVYLDSDHTYAHVTREMEFFWQRLLPGGVLAGHDYRDCWLYGDDLNRGVLFGVKSAVDDFAKRVGRVVGYTLEEWPTWYFRKPIGDIAPSQIAVVSAATDNLPWREMTAHNHAVYCERHGYKYKHRQLAEQSPGSAAWAKLEAVSETLDEAEFVMWIDSDAVFMRHDQRLEDFWDGVTPALFFKDNINGLNSGVFFVRRCEQSIEFLEAWQSRRKTDQKWWENGALIEIEKAGELIGMTLPHRIANSHPHLRDCWQRGDFIAHLTALKPDVRMAFLADLCARASAAEPRSDSTRECSPA